MSFNELSIINCVIGGVNMAVPQRRISKTVKRKRRTHQKLVAPNLISCSNCGEKIKSHIVCPNCGYYDGKKVL